jgi:hypothetical protein
VRGNLTTARAGHKIDCAGSDVDMSIAMKTAAEGAAQVSVPTQERALHCIHACGKPFYSSVDESMCLISFSSIQSRRASQTAAKI